MRKLGMLLSLAACAFAPRASAIEVAEGRLTVGGFGQWGYGRTAGENAYLIGNEDGEYENAQFSLALTAQPQDDVVVAGQVFLSAGGEVSLDWAFGEYRIDDLLRVRAGKVKNPFGLFMEVKDVGTLRPFFALPQSIYGPGNFGAESYLGAGITGEWQSARGWGLAYDLYGGALELDAFEPGEALGAGPPFDFAAVEIEEEDVRDVVGGRLSLLTPLDGLTVRISAYGGTLFEEDRAGHEHVQCYGLSAEYAREDFQIRGELFRATEEAVETNVAGYAEVAWSFLPKLQAALRFERSHQTKAGVPGSSPVADHHEGAVGLAFWPSPSLVFKASYHLVYGNRFAVPELSAADGSMDAYTHLVVAGAQFAF
jgi:hypothetical protein